MHHELVPNPRPAAHGCNACELPDGSIWLMWFAGTREGNEDQRVLHSVLQPGSESWSAPKVLVDHIDHAGERWVPEVAAPLVSNGAVNVAFSAAPISGFFQTEQPKVFRRDLKKALLFVAPPPGNSRAVTGDTIGRLEPIRTAEPVLGRIAVILQGKSMAWDGDDWLLQCNSFDDQDRHSSSLVVGRPGGTWRLARELTCDPGCLEPSTVRFADGSALCYSRYGQRGSGCIWRSESANVSLESLSDPRLTTLRNPSSGIDIAVDGGERLLIAYNDSHRLRTPLTLGVSDDRGETFRCVDVETDTGEYSYPKLMQSADGVWHLFYTWRRECISHVSFTPEELLSGRPVFGLEPE